MKKMKRGYDEEAIQEIKMISAAQGSSTILEFLGTLPNPGPSTAMGQKRNANHRGGEIINSVWQANGNKFTSRPQLLVFIVNDKDIDVYRRIKKSCDCRFGVVSQALIWHFSFKRQRPSRGFMTYTPSSTTK
ncbi:hypothetical protein BU16DRAFT_566497 [Lophium mytilinum]|uniref:Uncharacterized protein n=1 Tax=Lophium mytilinum TaxID=390894 RepID=A0A6A6QEE0_9PEZI|nr:hypothetical protein BU16DRAFT_566497 [Lophium mytilinum]